MIPEFDLLTTNDIKLWLKTSKAPMFSRFDDYQLVKDTQQSILDAGELFRVESHSILSFEPDISYAVVSGLGKVRDHSKSAKVPEVLWNIQSGDYLCLESCSFLCHPEVIVRTKTQMVWLKINSFKLKDALKRARPSTFIVRQQVMMMFSLFQKFSQQTTDLLIDSLLVFKTASSGQVLLTQLAGHPSTISRSSRQHNDEKADCDFYIIISGLCELRGADGFVLALVGAGDYFGEESLIPDVKGFASLGSVIAKDSAVEYAVLPKSVYYRVPRYELNKFHSLIKKSNKLEIAEYHSNRAGQRALRKFSSGS